MATKTITDTVEKIDILTAYLVANDYPETESDDIQETTWDSFEVHANEYMVLTDGEADNKASEYIKESLWAFNADFIIQNTDLPWEAKEMIESFQRDKCEGANETIAAMITDIDDFIEAAISADGRGHFLNTYDGEENEIFVNGETFYIYRIN